MKLSSKKTELVDIRIFSELFLSELHTQIRFNAVHERRWSDSYMLSIDGMNVGYGSVRGQDLEDRDTIFEFYVVPSYRRFASLLFREVIEISKAVYVECQSNDPTLSALAYEFCENVSAKVILFEEHGTTNMWLPDAVFRERKPEDAVFRHAHEPEGPFVIEKNNEIVATGGFLLHYNPPFSDLYMEVREDARRNGIGSYLIQEIKKKCYLSGRIPAARCDINNHASKSTLLKAGLKVSGFLLLGKVRSHP